MSNYTTEYPERFAKNLLNEFLFHTEPSKMRGCPNVKDNWLKCIAAFKEKEAIKQEAKTSGWNDDFRSDFGRTMGRISRGLNGIKAEARLRITKKFLFPKTKDGSIDYSKTSVLWAIKIQKQVFGSRNNHSDLVWLASSNRRPEQRRIKWEPEEEAILQARIAWDAFQAELKKSYYGKTSGSL